MLSGGEIAALAVIDAAVRLLPGVLNDGDSALQDSFNDTLSGLLDSPHYTRPEVYEGAAVRRCSAVTMRRSPPGGASARSN